MRRQKTRQKRRGAPLGFTLIEMLVIVLVIGVLSALSAPNISEMLDAIKVNQTVSDLRVSLQDTQRQAIRKNEVCTISVSQKTPNNGNGNGHGNGHGNGSGNGNGKKTSVQGNCLTSGSPEISEDVGVATNLTTSIASSSQTFGIAFGSLGNADFTIQSSVQPPNLPTDPSGKIVAFIPNKNNVQKKCIAVSSTLGLTRIGTYTGGIDPADITDGGVCTALDWKQQ